MLAIRALKGNYTIGDLTLLIFFLILHLNQASAEAGSAMLAFLYYRYYMGAELALGAGVFAFERVMLEFFLLLKLLATALAGNFNILAVI